VRIRVVDQGCHRYSTISSEPEGTSWVNKIQPVSCGVGRSEYPSTTFSNCFPVHLTLRESSKIRILCTLCPSTCFIWDLVEIALAHTNSSAFHHFIILKVRSSIRAVEVFDRSGKLIFQNPFPLCCSVCDRDVST
jgi:hypothetical protein